MTLFPRNLEAFKPFVFYGRFIDGGDTGTFNNKMLTFFFVCSHEKRVVRQFFQGA